MDAMIWCFLSTINPINLKHIVLVNFPAEYIVKGPDQHMKDR